MSEPTLPPFQEPLHWDVAGSIAHLLVLAREETLMHEDRRDGFLNRLGMGPEPFHSKEWLEWEEKRAFARVAEGLEVFFKTLYYIDHPDATQREVRKVAGENGHQISKILDKLSPDTVKALEDELVPYRIIAGKEKLGGTEGFILHYRNPLTETRYQMERPIPGPPSYWGNPKAILPYLPEFLRYVVECRKGQVSKG